MRSLRVHFLLRWAVSTCSGYGGWRRLINPVAVRLVLLLSLVPILALADPVALATAKPLKLLVFGDSLVAGYGLPQADAFPVQLERALAAEGLPVSVVNGGVSGETTTGGRARLAWTLGEGDAQPEAVIVELGANDALRGVDPDVSDANLDAILSEMQRRGIPVLLAGMRAPPNMGTDYTRRFDALYPRLAKVHNVPLYPFFLDGVAANPALNQADGLHPNAAGVTEIVRRITPAVVAWLRSMEKDRVR